MQRKTYKQLCEDAEQHVKVTNADELRLAIPDLVAVSAAIKNMRSLIKTGNAIVNSLTEACSAYALRHTGCFDNGLKTNPKGVRTGDLTIDGVTYHFVNGFNGFKRIDGEDRTQDFLETLPGEWLAQKMEIDGSKINDLKVSDEDLADHGLCRVVKNEWSEKHP